MNHKPWLELAEFHALGVLDGEELDSFKGHLNAGCAECEKHILDVSGSLSALSSMIKPSRPSPETKAKLMRLIAQEGAASGALGRPRALGLPWAPLGFGLGLAAAALWLMLSLIPAKTPVDTAMEHSPAMIEILQSPDLRKVIFKGLEADPNASAALYWNPNRCGGCFMVKHLASLPVGKVFQLWAIKENSPPVSAGTFTVEANGQGHLDFTSLPQIQHYTQFAVTMEPAGGMPHPTGAMHLAGSL